MESLIGQTNNLPVVREQVKTQIYLIGLCELLIMQRRMIIDFYTIDWIPQSEIPNSRSRNSGIDCIPIMDTALHVNIQLQRLLIDNKLPCNLSSYNTSHHSPSRLPCTQNTSISILNTLESLLILNPESQLPSRPHGPQECPAHAHPSQILG
jgi:hypothetical protein